MTKRPSKPSSPPELPGFADRSGQVPFEPGDAPEKVVLPPYKPYDPPPRVRTRIGPGGRVVIPAAFRAAAGMEEGAEVMLTLVGQEVQIITPRAALRQVQEELRKLIPPGANLVDELLAERRAEAEAEGRDE